MTWVDPNTLMPAGLPLTVEPQAPTSDPPDFLEVWKNDFMLTPFARMLDRTSNWIDRQDAPAQPGYDAFHDIAGYEQFASRFTDSHSPMETQLIKGDIDQVKERQAVLAAGSGWQTVTSGLIDGILDPVSLIPYLGWEIKGGKILAGMAEGAARGGVAALAGEPIRRADDPTRTWEQGLETTMEYSLVASLMGGGLSFLKRAEIPAVAEGMRGDALAEASRENPAVGMTMPQSAGAAGVEQRTAAGTELTMRKGVSWWLRNRVVGSPVGAMLASTVDASRRFALDIADNPFHTNLEGTGVGETAGGSVYHRARGWLGAAARDEAQGLEANYQKYRERVRDELGRPMPRSKFYEAVTAAGHRGKSDIPEAMAAANVVRSGYFNEALSNMKEVGLLPADFKADPLYWHRVWNQNAIFHDRMGAVNMIAEHLRMARISASKSILDLQGSVDKLSAEIERAGERVGETAMDTPEGIAARSFKENLGTQLEHARADLETDTWLAGADDASIMEHTQRAVDKIMMGHFARDASIRTGEELAGAKRGPVLRRMLSFVPNTSAEPWLEMNASHILNHHAATVGPQIEMMRKFGSLDGAAQQDAIRTAYDKLMEDQPGKSEALTKERERDLKTAQALRDIVLGTYRLPNDPNGIGARSLRFLLNMGLLTKGGSFLIMSLPDMAQAPMRFGFQKTFADGLSPLFAAMKDPELAAHVTANKNELRNMGANLELVHNLRIIEMANQLSPAHFGRTGVVEQAVQSLTDRYGQLTGMSQWNNWWKNVAGFVSMKTTLQDVLKIADGTRLGTAAQKRLDHLGIGTEQAIQIAEQFRAHGEMDGERLADGATNGRVWNANWESWTNSEARRAFQSSVVKEVEATILTPGPSRPLWMHGPLGRLIGQFRTFTADSMNKITLSGLQTREKAALSGLVFSFAMGGLAFTMKQLLAQIADPTRHNLKDVTLEQFTAEALNYSGIAGWLFDVDNAVQTATTRSVRSWAHFAAGDETGPPPLSKFGVQSGWERFLGPITGETTDLVSTMHSLFETATGQRSLARSDISRMRQTLIPYQNIWWASWALDYIQRKAEDTANVPETRQ